MIYTPHTLKFMFVCFVKTPQSTGRDKSKEKAGIEFLCVPWKSVEDMGADAPSRKTETAVRAGSTALLCPEVRGLIVPTVSFGAAGL